MSANASPHGRYENEIWAFSGLGAFVTHLVGRRILGFPCRERLNSPIASFGRRFGDCALLRGRHAHSLEMSLISLSSPSVDR